MSCGDTEEAGFGGKRICGVARPDWMLTLAFLAFFFGGDQVDQLMAFGQFWDARGVLNDRIRQQGRKADPHLYLQRATCEVNMRMYTEAIDDSSVVIKSRASSDEKRQAYVIRSNAYLRIGEFKKAESDAISAGDRQLMGQSQQAQRVLGSLQKAKKDEEKVVLLDQLLSMSPHFAKYVLMRANIAWDQGDRQRYAQLTDEIYSDDSKDATMIYRRGIIMFCNGDFEEARKAMRKASALKNASLTLKSMTHMNRYKQEANKALQNRKVEDAEMAINQTMSVASQFCTFESPLVMSMNLLKVRLMKLKGQSSEVMGLLTDLIDRSPESAGSELYLERGDLEMEIGDYDAALFDYQNAQSRDPRSMRAQEGINRAQQMKREASRVDYYAILGVDKGAGLEDIKNAYKQKVRQWHPDRYSDKQKKQEAETMMKKVNTAIEVLGDPEKRRMYDLGKDPDEIQSGGGGFPGGFDPFDLIRQTMGGGEGDPFDFFFGGGGGGGGQGEQHVQFGGDDGHFEFHFQF